MIARQNPIIPPRDTGPWRGVARRFALAVVGLTALASLGCQPQLDPQEYGELVTEVPYVPGMEKPYPLPDLEESPDNAKDSTSAVTK